MDLHQVVLQILLLDVGWHGRVDQFWCHRGTFATMGVIAIIISYYICWVQLIWTHFQIFTWCKKHNIPRVMDF